MQLLQGFWARFKRNRRAWVSFCCFGVLFVLTLAAEFVANDAPILLRYDGKFYMPIMQSYPETTFGGDFDTEADYRDPYVKTLIQEKGWMIWPPIAFSYDTINYELEAAAPSPPSLQNWLGTDDQARDVLARLLYGFRVSVLFGLALTVLTAIIGVLVGAVQGYVGGWFDLIGQRVLEIFSALPTLFIIMILSSVITPNVWWLFGIMLLFGWTGYVGVVRAECLKTRKQDYVMAARAIGVPSWKILLRHVLPNSLVATITYMPFVLAGSVTALTSLDFLGFGLPPGSASLGELLAQGKNNLNAPWLGLTTFGLLTFTLTALVFIGEGVRDALDPRVERV